MITILKLNIIISLQILLFIILTKTIINYYDMVHLT